MKYNLIKIALLFSMIYLVSCSNNDVKNYSSIDEWVEAVEPTVEFIEVEDLHNILDTADILVIDVREGYEYNPGYIPVAVNIPRGVIEFKMGNDIFWENQMLYPPEKDGAIVLVCKKGKRSLMTIEALNKLGYTNVKYLKGGFKAWEIKYPLEQEKNLEQVHDTGAEVGGC
ncbi:MAG: rhodanese-like domain-containing protein [Bacteroidales bacterium]|nr:rhodanese-like domain-containing protein [Bacteroidales bacterium]